MCLCVCPCVVPIDSTAGIKMLYVFVDIQMDTSHFLDTVRFNFPPGHSLALVSTIQFVAALQVICDPCVTSVRGPYSSAPSSFPSYSSSSSSSFSFCHAG